MAAAPLILASPVSDTVLKLFTGAVLVASVYAARPGGKPMVVGLALALADFLIWRTTFNLDTRWPVLLQTLLWLTTLIYVTATILQAIFAGKEVTVETLLAALCVFLLIGLAWAFAFTLMELMLPGRSGRRKGRASPGRMRVRGRPSYAAVCLQLCNTVRVKLRRSAPATGFACNAASLEAMTGQIFLAVVVARLVGLHGTQRSSNTADS